MATRRPAGTARQASAPRIGLALAGGGPLGAIFEIGALCALDEALRGVDFTQLAGYVGVSAGGFIAAGLANGMTPRELCTAFIETTGPDVVHPSAFVQPAWAEYAERFAALPGLMMEAGWRYAFDRRGLLTAVEHLGRALPTGLFSNAPLEHELARVLSRPGRSNDFRRLQRRLVLVATDLDSGQSAPFGLDGLDDVPISRAVAASAALPGIYPPVPIGGRWYVDGALKKTLHARVLLDMGMDLVLCLNPLVPFDAHRAAHRSSSQHLPHLVFGGLPVVLAQTFRTLIHSRLELGIRGYERSHPGTDILLFEPDQRDPEIFLANTFGYSQRRALAEHAYQQTRADLRSRRGPLARTLQRHGIALDHAVLDDDHRHLLGRRSRSARGAAATLKRLDGVLDELSRVIEVAPARG